MSNNFKNRLVTPCELEILNLEIKNNVDHQGLNELILTFMPLSQAILVPCDGVIETIKPFNFDYEIKLNDKKSTLHLVLGEGSASSLGFGFDMKVVTGQPVNLGDRLVSMNFEDLSNSIQSLVSKMSYKTNQPIKLKCQIGQKIKANVEILEE